MFRDDSRPVLNVDALPPESDPKPGGSIELKGPSAMQTVDPEPIQHQSGWRANSLTAILAFIAFLVGFGGRLFGLWLVAWGILSTSFDPVWPVEGILAGLMALIALTSAVILRRCSGPSRLISLAIVLSIITLLWSSFCGYFVLDFDGGSV